MHAYLTRLSSAANMDTKVNVQGTKSGIFLFKKDLVMLHDYAPPTVGRQVHHYYNTYI